MAKRQSTPRHRRKQSQLPKNGLLKLPDLVAAELEQAGVDWSLEPRSRHFLLRIGTSVVGILPLGPQREYPRVALNLRAHVRRHLRQRGR